MRHWNFQYVNRPLSKTVYLAVKWTRLVEGLLALVIRYSFARIRFLSENDARTDSTSDAGSIPSAFEDPFPSAD